MLIVRLIAERGQSDSALEPRLDAALAALDEAGSPAAMAGMLDFCGDVVQLSFPDADRAQVVEVLGEAFGPCDLLTSDREFEVPHLFVSDMDSTMIGQECIDELADFAGLKDKVSAITERAMRGELDFEAALRERVGLLAGLEETAIERCLAERIEPMAGARTLVATLRDKGARTVLVTGGFHHFADPVAKMLGFERVVGNRLAVANGKLTGELVGPITDSATKRRVLDEETGKLGEQAVSLASGDGANDIPMLEAATYGVAYHAKPAAREGANGRIDVGDLTAVLKLLGIPESEWVAG